MEFIDYMKTLTKMAEKICWANRHLLDNPEEWEPVFSFDRPTIHDPAYLGHLGIYEGQNTFPLPAYGGDVHKVIEHVHGYLVKQFAMYLQQIRGPQPRAVHRAQLKHLFECITVEGVQRDCMSLADTLRIIASPVAEGGTAGDWAPRPYN